ncbi:glucose-1-phosphate cytidylyltransferase [Clostridium bowmanii]|uniref:glucose-1-phosphate cytidylyltransferase n=1 Tax=Clostridium bowmanii TaxID=132925 RepID=UPI001C0D7A79|nr:glucose-1-phosphate cytidylyltransferase [Clostridium bowmanii]MBU3190612.1 glucose-1-phosphate cytidylyltransferase [Clostridium bowmanii]MCA1075145.1 glucose-1-phosphate cytidylyltransferase [Clostridium bowmanii]
MKVVILAGGFGTRLSEETELKPKPMVEIGGKPILWHIMKLYSSYGYNEFIICCGYKGYIIKEYFANYYMHMSDLTVDLHSGDIKYYNSKAEPWKITLIDTGMNTMTGGRLKRIEEYIENETFMMTYGDGIADVNINKILEFHKNHKYIATVTAVQPSGRFGALNINSDSSVKTFTEKPSGDNAWINGGFFVLEPKVFDYIQDDNTVFEKEPLEHLAKDDELSAYKHEGFWRPMDTLRDKSLLEEIWESGEAPWAVWK